jgi:hypothetical protein
MPALMVAAGVLSCSFCRCRQISACLAWRRLPAVDTSQTGNQARDLQQPFKKLAQESVPMFINVE